MPGFVHLHVHTEYSMLDGAAKNGLLFKEVARQGMSAVAISDHGNMFGAYEFYQTAKKTGSVKPIIGIEAYLAPESRFHKKQVFWGAGGVRGAGADGAEVVPLVGGGTTVPSALHLARDGGVTVGEGAQRLAGIDPGRVIRGLPQRIGDPTPIPLGNATWTAEDLLARVSVLADELPEVVELRLDPVVVGQQRLSPLWAGVWLSRPPDRRDTGTRRAL